MDFKGIKAFKALKYKFKKQIKDEKEFNFNDAAFNRSSKYECTSTGKTHRSNHGSNRETGEYRSHSF
ncbi:hypothetical protein FACS189421_00720 [Bacteroidia bacterium]|nr:hypothetical protein FACS189421_00720 [Bacteroidia bacterium]